MGNNALTPRFLGAAGLSQQEVLEDELAFASWKGSSAREARHFLQRRLGTGFDFDDIIKRLAIRARKSRWSATSHVTPPISDTCLLNSTLHLQARDVMPIVALSSQTAA